MEDIYCDLENYQFENDLSELRSENHELKCKLEEYASTQASLQKEFDKLSAEYKKLELNYSSLLKTARAEIERKSQMITNLNIEKDKLVVNVIQNRGRIHYKKFNHVNNQQQPTNQPTGKRLAKEGDSGREKNVTSVPNSTENSVRLSHERRDKHDKAIFSPSRPSLKDDFDVKEKEDKFEKVDVYRCKEKNKNKRKENHTEVFNNDAVANNDKTTFSIGVKDNFNVKEKEENSQKFDLYRDREYYKNENKKSNENDPEVLYNTAGLSNKVSKIRNRRKSMPVLNRGDFQFSSDEDQDDGPKESRFRRKAPLKDDTICQDRYRNHHGRNDPKRKVSELTRVGDKHASYYDSSKDVQFKNKCWYRESDRHKSTNNRDKHNKSNQRYRKPYSPDVPYHNVQGEYYNKHRESNDRFHRIDAEQYNQHRRSRESDGFQYEEVYSKKHKLHDAMEEPAYKRLKSESISISSNKHMPLYDRDVGLHDRYVDLHERDIGLHDRNVGLHDRDVGGCANSMSKPLELSYLSLQSPDHVHLENNPVLQVKEIKSTSDAKLEDPRLKSIKYIVNHDRDKVVLSTLVGRDVDVKVIDTATWNTSKDKQIIHEMPTPLKEKPTISEEFLKDVYMGINDPISNISLESGELCSEDEVSVVSKKMTDKVIVNPEQIISKCVYNNVESHDQFDIYKKGATDITNNTQQISKTSFSKTYRIPKLKKSNTLKLLEGDITYSTRNKLNKKDITKISYKKKNKEKRGVEKKLQPEAAIDIFNNKKNKLIDESDREHSPGKAMISARDTVEGDLELSDETCDYVDLSDQTGFDKANNIQKLSVSNKNVVIETVKKDLNFSKPGEPECVSNKQSVFEVSENKNFTISDKNHKEVLPKKSLSKSYKEQKPKDIKSKICDLFGDTSSLITLDDLGLVGSTATKENLNEYAPLFDNTQDAVDLNVEEMEKVQTRSMKLQRDEKGPFKNVNRKSISDTSENTNVSNKNNPSNKDNKEFNNGIQKSSSVKHILEKVNTEPEDNAVVKTVIISTGIQNNCHLVDAVRDGDQEKPLTTNQSETKGTETIHPTLASIQALATSTPYKPQHETLLSVSEIGFNTNKNVMTKEASNNSTNTESICKMSQNNLDIPDVRIIVKRRRKVKGVIS